MRRLSCCRCGISLDQDHEPPCSYLEPEGYKPITVCSNCYDDLEQIELVES